MTLKIACPSCTANLNVPERLVGKHVRCPRCGDPLLVEDPEAVGELDDFVEAEEVAPPPRRVAGTQTCPMCGAKNKVSAAQCTECGEELSGEEASAGEGVWRDGKKLVMRKTATLPYRCIKSNQPADGWLRRKLYWHHPAIYLLILLHLFIYVIVAICVRKKADIEVGLCDAWFRRRRWTIALTWLVALVALGVCIAGCAGLETPGSQLGGWLIAGGLIGGFIGVITGLILGTVVSATKITDEYVWMKGVHPDFLKSLPEWPGEDELPSRKRKRRR
jgi:predicted RNA-binding Zn-ribbon protein involved in translation (DUF1610 family)